MFYSKGKSEYYFLLQTVTERSKAVCNDFYVESDV